ncbi:hypothetical protein Tco_0642935 [Tanacetum coccineum]
MSLTHLKGLPAGALKLGQDHTQTKKLMDELGIYDSELFSVNDRAKPPQDEEVGDETTPVILLAPALAMGGVSHPQTGPGGNTCPRANGKLLSEGRNNESQNEPNGQDGKSMEKQSQDKATSEKISLGAPYSPKLI